MPLFHAFTLGLRYNWLRENGLPGDEDLHGEVGEGTDHQVHNLRMCKIPKKLDISPVIEIARTKPSSPPYQTSIQPV